MKTTLVIMAAGIGSRYGGDKQTDGLGPHGETLMEYSVYDALRAGFRKVVFIIRPEARDRMETLIGGKLRAFRVPAAWSDSRAIEVAYAVQDFSSIPSFYHIPAERVKPFGTGHALLCASEVVREPFCVINADDYYGTDAYRVMREALCQFPEQGRAAMVGFVLENTLSPDGTVSRGICNVKDGILQSVTERLTIEIRPDGVAWDADTGVILSRRDIVSMNIWGFAPSFFPALRAYFEDFLRNRAGDNPKAECQLPGVVNTEMEAGRLAVSVLHSSDPWFGVTYRKDRENVCAHLRALHEAGRYPDHLWG